MQLTDREILMLCASASSVPGTYYCEDGEEGIVLRDGDLWNPLSDDGDCARMENKCAVRVNCHTGESFLLDVRGDLLREEFTPGNDAERRRASCLLVAMAQIEKEKAF